MGEKDDSGLNHNRVFEMDCIASGIRTHSVTLETTLHSYRKTQLSYRPTLDIIHTPGWMVEEYLSLRYMIVFSCSGSKR